MDTELVIKNFNNAVGEFFTSRLIIVERVISKFLATLAAEPAFYSVVVECNKTVNYAQEFNKAITRDGVGGYFVLPTNKRSIVALVTGLLFDFDRKNIAIVEFVTRFFPSDLSHESYMAFCNNIITPFADAFRYMLVGEPAAVTQGLREELSIIPFPDKAKEDCDFWLRSLLDIVVGDNASEENIRREYLTMVNGLLHVLDSRNPILIKIVWIGLKNTFGYYKQGLRELNECEVVLRNYGVIE